MERSGRQCFKEFMGTVTHTVLSGFHRAQQTHAVIQAIISKALEILFKIEFGEKSTKDETWEQTSTVFLNLFHFLRACQLTGLLSKEHQE